MERSRIAPSIILAIGIAVAGGLIGRAIIGFKAFDRAVEVRGLSERTVKSNEASWVVSYSAAGNDLAELNRGAGVAQEALKQFLLSKGLKENEIQRQTIQITDNHTRGYGEVPEGTPRYSGQGSYVVATKNIDLIGKIAEELDSLISRNILVTANPVEYYFTDVNSIKPEMVREATAAARVAAKSFSADANADVGKILSAQQGALEIVSPYGEYDVSASLMKKIRVVTRVRFALD